MSSLFLQISSPELVPPSAMAVATSPPPQQAVLNFTTILSESRRVIKSQLSHFLALTFLFLLPLSVASTTYSNLHFLFTDAAIDRHNKFLNRTATGTSTFVPDHDQQDQPAKIILTTIYFLFYTVLSVCAAGSITYTAFQAFHHQPIKPISIVKSISTSFFPLLATILLVDAIVLAICIIFASVISVALLLGFQSHASSPYFNVFLMATAIPFNLVLIYLQVNWALASAVVVAESTWGFDALKRSKILVKGRRGLALFLCLVFMFWYVVLESTTSTSLPVTHEPKCLFIFVMAVQIVVTSTFKSMFMLFEMVLNTVIYVYCKAIRDEEKIGGEYVRLAVDDHENVAHDGVVYVNSVSKLDAFCEV